VRAGRVSASQCEVCGETRLPGWDVCPACGHPYPKRDATARRPPETSHELVPLPRAVMGIDEVLRRARSLPAVDPADLRADIDTLLDTGLVPPES
jgi:hypothetical protein